MSLVADRIKPIGASVSQGRGNRSTRRRWRQWLLVGTRRLCGRRLRCERPKGDRIAMTIKSGNAVLPDRARWSSEKIGGARFDRQRPAIPRLARAPAKAEHAGRKQRHADDLVELRLVPMPADPGPRPVFVDQHLRESVGGPVEALGDFRSQRLEKRRKRLGFDDGAAVVVVAIAKADHLPVGLIAMEIERLERQRGELARRGLFLISGQEIRMIAESLGQGARRAKEIGLTGQ